jgi:hypothetical protein
VNPRSLPKVLKEFKGGGDGVAAAGGADEDEIMGILLFLNIFQ